MRSFFRKKWQWLYWPLAIVLVGLAVYFLGGRFPENAKQTAIRQSTADWGKPLPANQVSVGSIQSSYYGAYRMVTYQFRGHFGELQTADFSLRPQDVRRHTVVWQSASTGGVGVAQSFDPDNGELLKNPISDGEGVMAHRRTVGWLLSCILAVGLFLLGGAPRRLADMIDRRQRMRAAQRRIALLREAARY